MADGDPETSDSAGPARPRAPRRDGALPHQAPFPEHVPRWLAWIVLIALVVSGAMCVRAVL